MAQLHMIRGPSVGKVYKIQDNRVSVGRGTRNDIIIIDNEVSREHCLFIRVDNGYELQDLRSSNGTFVNGQRVTDTWTLRNDCIIELGDSITFEYQTKSDESQAMAQVVSEDAEINQGYLIVTIGSADENQAIYPMDGEEISIGRGTNNDVIIIEPEMSRNHLMVRRTTSGYEVEDLKSTNGTLLNGSKLDSRMGLRSGDILRIGAAITLQFTFTPEAFLNNKQTSMLSVPEQHDITKRRLSNTNMLQLDPPSSPKPGTSGLKPDELLDKVYIAYDREDWNRIVAPLFNHLFDAKIPVWVDQHLEFGSQAWQAAIEQARLETWLLIVVVSKAGLSSDHVQKTWRHFQNREKPVVMLITESVERLPIGAKRASRVQYDRTVPDTSFHEIAKQIRERQSQ